MIRITPLIDDPADNGAVIVITPARLVAVYPPFKPLDELICPTILAANNVAVVSEVFL